MKNKKYNEWAEKKKRNEDENDLDVCIYYSISIYILHSINSSVPCEKSKAACVRVYYTSLAVSACVYNVYIPNSQCSFPLQIFQYVNGYLNNNKDNKNNIWCECFSDFHTTSRKQWKCCNLHKKRIGMNGFYVGFMEQKARKRFLFPSPFFLYRTNLHVRRTLTRNMGLLLWIK